MKPSKIELKELETFLKKLIVKAGKETLKYYGKAKVEYTKDDKLAIVTKADLASNKLISEAIKKQFPKHGIISEEEKEYNKKSDFTWIVDPLDGTINFQKQIPIYAVLIGLRYKKEMIMGAAYFPLTKDLYFAEKGKGAYKNNKRIHSSKNGIEYSRCNGAILSEGNYKKEMQRIIDSHTKTNYWLSNFGCGAYDQLLVAEGKSDWFIGDYWTYTGIWDFAAPSIIMTEAGCKFTYIDDNKCDFSRKGLIISGNSKVHKQLKKIANGEDK